MLERYLVLSVPPTIFGAYFYIMRNHFDGQDYSSLSLAEQKEYKLKLGRLLISFLFVVQVELILYFGLWRLSKIVKQIESFYFSLPNDYSIEVSLS